MDDVDLGMPVRFADSANASLPTDRTILVSQRTIIDPLFVESSQSSAKMNSRSND